MARTGGAGTLICADVATPSCTHTGGVPGAPGERRFYNAIGACEGSEAAE
jgi:hypothetical protein